MQSEIELYYWPTPNGWKISIALEEMELPYTTWLINLAKGAQFEEDFTRISPNGRMPAIIDPDGPDGQPVSVFESGAILQYLACKTGLFYGQSARDRIAVDEWLMWQMGGLGPICGQFFHFAKYAPSMEPPQVLPYAQDRFRNEVTRLFHVLNRRLGAHEYVAGDFYSIADMAIWPWASLWRGMEQELEDKPHVSRWLAQIKSRPTVQRGRALNEKDRIKPQDDPSIHKTIFGQRT